MPSCGWFMSSIKGGRGVVGDRYHGVSQEKYFKCQHMSLQVNSLS